MQWKSTKIVVGRTNLWSLIAKAHDGSPNNLDFETMEGLFCQQSTMNGQQSPRLGTRSDKNGRDSLDRKKRESSELIFNLEQLLIESVYLFKSHDKVYQPNKDSKIVSNRL
ncbi:UNVERIFIED_CONTAM: hypothetical protein NCL1_09615 [Trichonephila clavipes]